MYYQAYNIKSKETLTTYWEKYLSQLKYRKVSMDMDHVSGQTPQPVSHGWMQWSYQGCTAILKNSYYYIIQVYSNAADGEEELTFKYYDLTNNEVVEYTETLMFENNMIIGDGFNPLRLSREGNKLSISRPPRA